MCERTNRKWTLGLRAAVCLLAATFACQEPLKPSADYAEASRLYVTITTQKGLGAYADPRMAKVLELCEQVPPESLDAEAAVALAARVRKGIAEEQTLAERREAPRPVIVAVAEGSEVSLGSPAPSSGLSSLPRLLGAGEAEIRERWGDCLKSEGPFVEKGGSRHGTAWSLVESEECSAIQPSLAGQLVFIADGKVFNVAPKADAERTEVRTRLPPTEKEIQVEGETPEPQVVTETGPVTPYVPGMPVPDGVDPRTLVPVVAEPVLIETGAGLSIGGR